MHLARSEEQQELELERTGGRYGLQTMCEGGGQANVTIIERL
jgi:acetyl-CoA acetyltransferase